VSVEQASAGPDFIIAGGLRCGTTAMSLALAGHPQIYMATPKELFYFSTDFPRLRQAETLDGYLALFRAAQPKHRLRGEATAAYLYSEQAAQAMNRAFPDIKLVVMLRNPADLVVRARSTITTHFGTPIHPARLRCEKGCIQ